MAKNFEYFINLDERGEFFADIRNEKGESVFEIQGLDIFTDGFMNSKHDTVGLRDYLVDLKVLKCEDSLSGGNENMPVAHGRKNKF